MPICESLGLKQKTRQKYLLYYIIGWWQSVLCARNGSGSLRLDEQLLDWVLWKMAAINALYFHTPRRSVDDNNNWSINNRIIKTKIDKKKNIIEYGHVWRNTPTARCMCCVHKLPKKNTRRTNTGKYQISVLRHTTNANREGTYYCA